MASTALDREAVDQAVARGSELLRQGNLDDAQTAFRAALMLDNENPRVLALLGLTHFRAGQFTQARPIYEELVERAPTDASHRLNLGLVYLKLGESDKAIGSLEASRALDPSQGRAVSYLGLAYARAGRYAEAYRSFLLAGQNDLATEIETNLTAAERESIHAQLSRPERRTPPPPPASRSDIPLSMPAIVVDRPPEHDPPPDAPIAEVEPARFEPPPTDTPQPSMPEIVVDRPELDEPAATADAAPADGHTAATDEDADEAFSELMAQTGGVSQSGAPATEITPSRMTDSLQFVMPERDAVPTPAEGQSMISRAVEVASPAAAAATHTLVASGSRAPLPLSQLATDHLVRPEDGQETFELTTTGALIIRVTERVLTRLDGVHVTGGELEFEPAMRRSRGSSTDEKFDYGGSRLHSVSGKGYLIAVPDEQTFTAVTLDDDIFYLREDLVFAFEESLRWENGNVPGLRGKLPVVQFRGDGAVALRSPKPLVRVKLPVQGVVYVDAARLAGWIGRVIPRAVVPPRHGPMGEVCVECTGEGVVLVDPSTAVPGLTAPLQPGRSRAPSLAAKAPPPPPQPAATSDESGPVELNMLKNADWLVDDDDGANPAAQKPDES